jgi:hypothetical protein
VTLLVAIVTGLWQLYKHFSDRTAMRKRRQILCDELRDHLGRIDSETNWSHRHFVPLDAEVEVLKDDHKRRRIMDLFAGIRTNRRSLMFLVMGDPGSGNVDGKAASVARTFRRDLDALLADTAQQYRRRSMQKLTPVQFQTPRAATGGLRLAPETVGLRRAGRRGRWGTGRRVRGRVRGRAAGRASSPPASRRPRAFETTRAATS